ncbi:Golgi SNAP receptor complex member 1-like isoform X4 [Nelusetta ayraudi]|uniref:Golgi SNAP receptor complex member 1-like isoform X4 n=1 Tax=Nelusetta ayraudi TaxID=303726 RepID=UPI003F70AADB
MSTTNMASDNGNWEEFRKQARQLENELDLKLVSFSKLCTSYSSSSKQGQWTRDSRTDSVDTSHDTMLAAMTAELEQLLASLIAVNDKMAESMNMQGPPSHNAGMMHTLQRHRDILQDYTHEYQKTKNNFFTLREREDLLGSVHREIESYKSGSGVNNRKTELFLKEHQHLKNSDSLIDNAIRPFPHHQQPHPQNQFAQEAGLFHSRRGDRHLHHSPVALHFPLTHFVSSGTM